jgi:hypothetical protein
MSRWSFAIALRCAGGGHRRAVQGERLMKSGNRWFLTIWLALIAWAWFGAPSFAQK